jgi:biopolymer transport protein ExbD
MDLVRRTVPRPQIPATPLANLSFLVLTCVMIAGMFSASRGPALRFANSFAAGGFDDRGAVRVEVDAENAVRVDGETVGLGGLTAAVASRLAGNDNGSVLLAVSPDASYQGMVQAYAAVAVLPGPPRIAFANRARGGIE